MLICSRQQTGSQMIHKTRCGPPCPVEPTMLTQCLQISSLALHMTCPHVHWIALACPSRDSGPRLSMARDAARGVAAGADANRGGPPALDTAIVRIIKAQKELLYQQLASATVEAVKDHFKPDVGSIKRRIQRLVEQEYLRRDEDDMNEYVYVG